MPIVMVVAIASDLGTGRSSRSPEGGDWSSGKLRGRTTQQGGGVAYHSVHVGECERRRLGQPEPPDLRHLGRRRGRLAADDLRQVVRVQHRDRLVLEPVLADVQADQRAEPYVDPDLLAGLPYGGVGRVLPAVAEAAGQVPHAEAGLVRPPRGEELGAVSDHHHAAARAGVDVPAVATGVAPDRRRTRQRRAATGTVVRHGRSFSYFALCTIAENASTCSPCSRMSTFTRSAACSPDGS